MENIAVLKIWAGLLLVVLLIGGTVGGFLFLGSEQSTAEPVKVKFSETLENGKLKVIVSIVQYSNRGGLEIVSEGGGREVESVVSPSTNTRVVIGDDSTIKKGDKIRLLEIGKNSKKIITYEIKGRNGYTEVKTYK